MKRTEEELTAEVIKEMTVLGLIRPPTPEELAHHEAGHAVAALYLKIPFAEVTVVPNNGEKYLGKVKVVGGRRLGVETLKEIEDRLILEVSGPLSASIWAEEHGACSILNINELIKALDICERLHRISPGTDSKEALTYIMKRSKSLLHQHWAEVSTIADGLLREKTLSRQRVLKLLMTEARGDGTQREPA